MSLVLEEGDNMGPFLRHLKDLLRQLNVLFLMLCWSGYRSLVRDFAFCADTWIQEPLDG